MKKTGRVLLVENNHACVKTAKGEFYKLKIKGKVPEKGDIYTGYTDMNVLSYIIIFLISILLISGVIFSILYYTPTDYVILDAGYTYKLKVNRFNYVISCDAGSTKAYNLIENKDLSMSPLDDSLCLLLKTCMENKAIKPSSNLKSDLILYISGKTKPDVDHFRSYTLSHNLRLAINYNGKDISYIDK